MWEKNGRFMRLFGKSPVYKAMSLFGFQIWNKSEGMTMGYLNIGNTLEISDQ